MKTRSILSSLALLSFCTLLLLPIGCATTDNSQSLESLTHVAAYVGTAEALREHPDWRDEFEQASAELALLEQGPIDIIALVEIVQRLPVKELRSDRAVLYISAATILLSDHLNSIPIERLENIRPIISALRRGIDRGLQTSL